MWYNNDSVFGGYMEKVIIARKTNFSLITWISGMILMAIVIYFRYEEPLLRYIFIAFFGYFFLFFIIHILQPKILITRDNEKLYIHRTFKTIAIEKVAIATIAIKIKNSRGVKYSFGKFIITLKNGDNITIRNVNELEKVKDDIYTFIGE